MTKQRQSSSNQSTNQSSDNNTQQSTSFTEHKCSVRIHLHPSRLGSVKDGVNEQLNALLMTYQPHLQGIILSYSHVHLPTTLTGSIFYERPYVNFDITVSFTVLSLSAQSLITGIVHNIARDHIGLLIHSTFNAVISTQHLPSHFKYQRDPQGTSSSYVDTRFSHTSELAAVDESTMTKAQKDKLAKAQAKEARRLAYLASQGLPAEPETKPTASSHSDSSVPTHWHNIAIGSHIKFSVINVQSEDGLVNIIGSLTAPGAELLLVEPTIPESFHAAAEADAAVMNDDHENEMEKIFGMPHQASEESDEQQMIENQVAAASGQLVIDDGHVSKKDAKAAKKAAKEASHKAKMERKRLRASGQYVPAPGQSNEDDDSNVVHTNTGEPMLKKQRREDAPVSVKKQKRSDS